MPPRWQPVPWCPSDEGAVWRRRYLPSLGLTVAALVLAVTVAPRWSPLALPFAAAGCLWTVRSARHDRVRAAECCCMRCLRSMLDNPYRASRGPLSPAVLETLRRRAEADGELALVGLRSTAGFRAFPPTGPEVAMAVQVVLRHTHSPDVVAVLAAADAEVLAAQFADAAVEVLDDPSDSTVELAQKLAGSLPGNEAVAAAVASTGQRGR